MVSNIFEFAVAEGNFEGDRIFPHEANDRGDVFVSPIFYFTIDELTNEVGGTGEFEEIGFPGVCFPVLGSRGTCFETSASAIDRLVWVKDHFEQFDLATGAAMVVEEDVARSEGLFETVEEIDVIAFEAEAFFWGVGYFLINQSCCLVFGEDGRILDGDRSQCLSFLVCGFKLRGDGLNFRSADAGFVENEIFPFVTKQGDDALS